jgi:hypothetical protein
MNEAAERACVLAVSEGCIEARHPAPAEAAPSVLIERSVVDKGGVAIAAEVLGHERLG